MKVGADISSLGLLPQLGEEIPKTKGEQFESLLAQQLVHAMLQGASLGQAEGEGALGSSYLSMMEGVLTRELAKGGQLGIAKAVGLGEEP